MGRGQPLNIQTNRLTVSIPLIGSSGNFRSASSIAFFLRASFYRVTFPIIMDTLFGLKDWVGGSSGYKALTRIPVYSDWWNAALSTCSFEHWILSLFSSNYRFQDKDWFPGWSLSKGLVDSIFFAPKVDHCHRCPIDRSGSCSTSVRFFNLSLIPVL